KRREDLNLLLLERRQLLRELDAKLLRDRLQLLQRFLVVLDDSLRDVLHLLALRLLLRLLRQLHLKLILDARLEHEELVARGVGILRELLDLLVDRLIDLLPAASGKIALCRRRLT